MDYGEPKKLILITSAFSASFHSSYLLKIKIVDKYTLLCSYRDFLAQKGFKASTGSIGGMIFLEIDCDITDLAHLIQEKNTVADKLVDEIKQAWENYRKGSWEIRTRNHVVKLETGSPLLMGIVNITPDSFYDGGKYFSSEAAVEHALRLQEEGAHIIDIGGQSTRPGSIPVSPEEESDRIMPVLSALKNRISVPISVDTYNSKVADAALRTGADMVNDTSALTLDEGMHDVITRNNVPVVIMHYQESLQPMPQEAYYGDSVYDISVWLKERIDVLKNAGINNGSIIIDPGIGFGKELEHNLEIVHKLDAFRCLGHPVLLGLSRKSFIGKIVPDKGPQDRLEGTIAACVLALLKGAAILRVHDVKAVKNALDIAKGIINGV